MSKNYLPGWRSRNDEKARSLRVGRLVLAMRKILPVSAVVILLSVVIWPKVKQLSAPPAPKTIEKVLKVNPKLENKVINPQYNSINKDGKPYSFKANSALQIDDNETKLDKPSGEITLKDGSSLWFSANIGVYKKDSNVLYLNEQVRLKTSKGHDVVTNSGVFYIAEQRGEGSEPVKGVGPNGQTIDAQGFAISNEDEIITFNGKTHISLPTS